MYKVYNTGFDNQFNFEERKYDNEKRARVSIFNTLLKNNLIEFFGKALYIAS